MKYSLRKGGSVAIQRNITDCLQGHDTPPRPQLAGVYESGGGCWWRRTPTLLPSCPASNPWGFVTEDEGITNILVRGFDLPPEDPGEISCGVYTDRMDVYYRRWAHFHAFLKMNIEVLGETVLDISAFLKDTDDLEEETLDQDAERELSPDERFLYFLDSLTSGEITEQDLLAEPDPED